MDIPHAVRFGILLGQQVFIRVVFGDFRGEGHHLSGRRMARHVGVAQVHVVLVYCHDAVHDVFHLCLALAFGIAPLAVDDVFLRYFGLHFHQFVFYEVLYFFYFQCRMGEVCDDPAGNFLDKLFLFFQSGGLECFPDSVRDFGCRKAFLLSVPFNDANVCCVHTCCYYKG